VLRNLANNFKRFNSREIPGAKVTIEWADHRFELLTDSEGYFRLEQKFSKTIQLPDDDLWQQAKVTVSDIPGSSDLTYQSYLDVLLPPADAEFGIISDIDDTILKTDVTSRFKLRVLAHTLLKNAASRRGFDEVSEFFDSLQKGPENNGLNPVFYVSNSPWNLYDLLVDFLELNELPKGPILLRDFGLPYRDRPADYQGHKLEQVKRILRTYPDLPFVLVGDSGEKDTDIYLTLATENPGRIKAIYIRDVQHERRARRVEDLIEKYTDVSVYLVYSYAEAQDHARRMELID
jgi:phosphatidate phosphatase APP1